MNYDNPAARLHRLLTAAKSISPKASCTEAWCKLLELTPQPISVLTARVATASMLPRLTIDALKEAYPGRKPNWDHWEQHVCTAFQNQNLLGTFETFIVHIDRHSLTYLEMAADLLAVRSPAVMPEPQDISKVRTELNDILVDVLASQLPIEVRNYLVRSLQRMILGLDEYKITGNIPVLEAIESALGHTAFDSEYKSFLQSEDLGKRFLNGLNAAAAIITVASGIPSLTAAFKVVGLIAQ